MKKTVIAFFAGLASTLAFAGVDSGTVVVSFSSAGPDYYADGELVRDNECYALVWTPTGSEFAGINADGTAAGNSKVVLTAPVASGHKCPNVNFQIEASYASKFTGGTFGVYLLDTRRYKTDENGVILTDEKGEKIFDSVGGGIVNGYGAVATLNGISMSSGSASSTVVSSTASLSPESASNLKVSKIEFHGEDVYIYVSGSLSCMSYGLKAGDSPTSLTTVAGREQYGADTGDMIIIQKKQPGAQFFQVNRK